MSNIKFSKKEFEKSFKLTDELKEKISLFGTHFEGISEDGNEIELEITANRPDLLSAQGFLRAFSIFMGKKKNTEYKIKKSDAKIIVDPAMKNIRPYSMAVIIKGIKFTDEKIKDIMQWQEKIHATIGRNRKKVAIGYYVLDKIKFPVKYTAKAPKEIKFIPLDMNEQMDGLQILQRHPTGRDYARQLEGFDKFPVYYDDNNSVLSMPPIINSNESGHITAGVSDILVECSGTNLETLKKVMSLAACDLIDSGGEAYQVEIVYGTKKESLSFEPEKIKLNLENANKLIGIELKENEISKLLEKMGYNYNSKDKIVEVPAWRTDIMHEVDIIEDIAIAYGYENLKPELPSIATTGEISKIEILKKRLSEILAGLNMLEISNYHLLTKEEAENVNIREKDTIEVADSKSEWKILRPNLICIMLNTLKNNLDAEYPQRVFELGRIFEKDKTGKSETGINEQERLCVAICSPNAGFTEIKQTLEYIVRMLGKHKEIIIETAEDNDYFIQGRCAKVMLGKELLGYFGEIKPQTLSSLSIKMPLALLEINIEKLL
ncbi:MAG: phenylalanine--tRNA ligase subunit beta [Nanoarchaeota archaeon]